MGSAPRSAGPILGALLLAALLLWPTLASGRRLTKEEGAGPLYQGRDLLTYLAPLPGEAVSQNGGRLARGWLMVPNRSNSSGAVCAKPEFNPPLAALAACRALGWSGTARAAGAPPPANATTIGEGGVAWEWLLCDGTEPGPAVCRFKPVEANFTGCRPKARLVIECTDDPGEEGQLRLGAPPPAATAISDFYSKGLTVEVFHNGFWGYPGIPFSPREAVVMCRQAGFPAGTAGVGDISEAGLGILEVGSAPALSRLQCNGTEAALSGCDLAYVPPLPDRAYFTYPPRGSLSYFVGPYLPLLYCPPAFNETEAADGGPVEDLTLRLYSDPESAAPGSGCLQGDAQIAVDGYWGWLALAGNGSDPAQQELAQASAQVICQQLGAPIANVTAALTVPSSPVQLPVWVSDLECTGQEESVLQCAFSSTVVPGGYPELPVPPFSTLAVSCC